MSAAKLPQWKCHKVVRAAEIQGIAQGEIVNQEKYPNGSWLLTVDGVAEPREVSHEWFLKHRPQVGGYYVEYEDGYTSYSPTEAFESGYTRLPAEIEGLPAHQQRVVMEAAKLEPRLERLTKFLASEAFNTLPVEESDDLRDQQGAMTLYLEKLNSRIARFRA